MDDAKQGENYVPHHVRFRVSSCLAKSIQRSCPTICTFPSCSNGFIVEGFQFVDPFLAFGFQLIGALKDPCRKPVFPAGQLSVNPEPYTLSSLEHSTLRFSSTQGHQPLSWWRCTSARPRPSRTQPAPLPQVGVLPVHHQKIGKAVPFGLASDRKGLFRGPVLAMTEQLLADVKDALATDHGQSAESRPWWLATAWPSRTNQ